jgi:hypothetical protein
MKWSKPKAEDFWNGLIDHVHLIMCGYVMKRVTCSDVLNTDDSSPVVVQLKAKDNSESHAICLFQGCIYDSASRFVLDKHKTALDWCCEPYGFQCHLRVYRLTKKEMEEPKQMKKKRRRA